MRGENSQGSSHDQYCGAGTGTHTRGTRYVPTDDLVNAYEMIYGSPVLEDRWISPDDSWELRDPRFDFTIVRLGSYYLVSYRFPNYIYEDGAYNDISYQHKLIGMV